MAMDMVSAIEDTMEDTMAMPGHMDMDMEDTGERRKGQLMPRLQLSLLLMLMLGTVPMDMAVDPMDMDMAGHTMLDTTLVDYPTQENYKFSLL